MSRIEALVRTTYTRAFKDPKAFASLIILLRQCGYGADHDEAAVDVLLGPEYEAIIDDFLGATGSRMPQAMMRSTPGSPPRNRQSGRVDRMDGEAPFPASLAAAIIGTDLYSFIRASFPIVSGGSQFLPNWHVEAMAYELSEVMRGRTRRLIITVPPRSLKSICASVALPAFALGHDPSRRIICVSYSRAWHVSTLTTAVL